MAELMCVVVTPEATVLEAKTDFVVLPAFDGEIGIAVNHSPLIGRLGYGELRIGKNVLQRLYIDGGFVQVADNVVTVLTNRAVFASQLDARTAEEQLEVARRRPAGTPETLQIRDRAVAQARAQIRVARRSR